MKCTAQCPGSRAPAEDAISSGPDGELPEELARLDQHLVEQVCNEVMHSGGLVQWDDIAGQDHAKQLVQEMVVWPMMNPHIFKVRVSMGGHRLPEAAHGGRHCLLGTAGRGVAGKGRLCSERKAASGSSVGQAEGWHIPAAA